MLREVVNRYDDLKIGTASIHISVKTDEEEQHFAMSHSFKSLRIDIMVGNKLPIMMSIRMVDASCTFIVAPRVKQSCEHEGLSGCQV